MDHKDYQNHGWRKSVKDKKAFYRFLLVGLVFLIVLVAAGMFFRQQERGKAEKTLEAEKQTTEQTMEEKRRNATYSRFTFFLASPVGERGGMNMPTYQEGNWRISDTLNKSKKMTILYVKNSETGIPLMYIRYGERQDFKLEAGEKELKTDSKKLIYVYYFYPSDSYQGVDKEDFILVQNDFENALGTFSIF
jgi:hypothetical protein